MASDADRAHARDQTVQALREKGVSSAAAQAIANAAANNSERRDRGLPTTSHAIPTHRLRERD